jgi:ankyrin repeat protein
MADIGAQKITDAFIEAACSPMDGSAHVSGTLDRAKSILGGTPEVATAGIHTAAILGNDAAVRQFLQVNPANATLKGGPHEWDPLTCLCFSRFLRLDEARSDGFIASATMLLDAGASPNTGFYSEAHEPEPVFESALYGAAGVAHHAKLTQLLLDHGADPNDGETEYHAPEWFDNRPMEIIVESGKLAPAGLTTMLHRKLDWTNYAGVMWLLDHGADPNAVNRWGARALDHALGRDNPLKFFELLLDYAADPLLASVDGVDACTRAAIVGRADVMKLFDSRGFTTSLEGDAAFLAACARGDADAARMLAEEDPEMVPRIKGQRPDTLANFAGAGNTAGVRVLLDFGFDTESRSVHPGSRGNTALHLAVWRERLPTVQLLIDRGASLEAENHNGDTPLGLATRALVEMSEWTPHDSTDIVAALLHAGASTIGVRRFPTGSAEADDLLHRFGRSG